MRPTHSLPGDDLSERPELKAAAVVVGTAPFGYLFGYLFTVLLVGSEALAVWLTTVALAAVVLVALALRTRPQGQ